jgi:hypothetical protein
MTTLKVTDLKKIGTKIKVMHVIQRSFSYLSVVIIKIITYLDCSSYTLIIYFSTTRFGFYNDHR